MLGAGCSVDHEHARLCERIIPWFEGADARVEVIERAPHPFWEHGVHIEYRSRDAARDLSRHWIDCAFAGGFLESDRAVLIGVTTDRRGEADDVTVAVLRHLWLGYFVPAREADS